MSDPNMLFLHLPESYIDVVKTYQSRKTEQTEPTERTEENPVAKALFRWVLPESEFVSDDSDSDDKEGVSHKHSSHDSETRKDARKSHRRMNIIITEETVDELCKHPQTDGDTDEDTASVDTENTAEIDSGDEWEDEDDDWCDTYSVSSSEGESLTGERLYDSWLSRATFLSPSDFYFSPTVDDFPRVPPPPVEATKQDETREEPSQDYSSPGEGQKSQQEFDFWAGFRSNLKKVQTFADDAIQDIRRKTEEAKRKRDEERRKAEEARRKEEEALQKAEDRRKIDEARRKADDILRQRDEARRRKLSRRNSFADLSSKSLPTTNTDRAMKRISSRSRLSSHSQERSQRSSRSHMVRDKMKNALGNSLDAISTLNKQSLADMKKPSLTRSRTSDNLAQFFAKSDKTLSRGPSGTTQNTSVSSPREDSKPKRQFDKLMDATKEMYENSKKRSPQQKNGENARPTHRRSRSQRLIPSALGQNDFPWY